MPFFKNQEGVKMKENDLETTLADPSSKGSVRPKKWWQWILLYPGLAISILGSIPTYFELADSFNFGVPYGRVFEAKEQNQLWQKNFQCSQNASFTPITNKYKVEVASTVCESGDVLIRSKRPEWDDPVFRWISLDAIVPDGDASKLGDIFGLSSTAYASESDNFLLAKSVICQKWIGEGQLLQRIQTASGCQDQIINTYSGQVVSSSPAPCTPNC
jgi:hypothetical protein